MVKKKLLRVLLTAVVCFFMSSGMSIAGGNIFQKVVELPYYVLIPNILDNQPEATGDCVLTNHSTTEAPDGKSIGVRNYACELNGRNVVFTVSIPKLCSTTSCGLIVDQHGATMNAAQQNAGTKLREYGWKAMQRGASTPYVVIQPNMTDLFDNGTDKLDPISVMGGAYDNELPILMLFVQNAISALSIDQTRVHIHGFSRGAQTANALYCDPATKSIFASYVGSGGAMNCALDKPFMMINGLTDPNVFSANSFIDEFNDSGTTSELLAQDPNWKVPSLKFTSQGLVPVGKQQHIRYQKGTLILENIAHSGVSYPLAGHCFPVTTNSGWLVCRTTFEIGQKIIDFFIDNPEQ